MEEGLRGHLCVQGDYEKPTLKDRRGVWRKDLGEYGGQT